MKKLNLVTLKKIYQQHLTYSSQFDEYTNNMAQTILDLIERLEEVEFRMEGLDK